MQKSYSVTHADLMAPENALFRITMQLSQDASAAQTAVMGKTVSFGDYRGTVTDITSAGITLKGENGSKTFPHSATRAVQLAAAGDTTPKPATTPASRSPKGR